jgi:cell division protease FtsH
MPGAVVARNVSLRSRISSLRKLKGWPKPVQRVVGSLVALGKPILSLMLLVVVLFVGYFVMLNKVQPSAPGYPITYDQLEVRARQDGIVAATFYDEDARMGIIDQTGQRFWTAYPRSDAETADLIDRMVKIGARVEIDHQSSKARLRFIAQFLMPLVILASLFGLFFLIMNRGGGTSEFAGFSKFTGKAHKGSPITFADVAGNAEAKTELGEVVAYLKDPGLFADLGALAPKGVLLAGPPGTGKTLLARAVAGEAGVPFFSMSGSEFVESLVGVGAARVRDLFRQARELAPAIIFIDELDAAGRARGAGVGQGNDEREQTLNQMLVEMDGFSVSAGIVILAATNRPDILDPALLRPGRFDRRVVVDVPDVEGRLAILTLYASRRPLGNAVDLTRIAKQTPGMTGADLSNLVNEASLLAVRARRREILQEDLEEAIDRVLAGPQRRSHVLDAEEKRLVALHEAGHAIAAAGVGIQASVNKLSVVARGRSLGHTTTYKTADKVVLRRSELEKTIVAHLGGVAIEQLRMGEISTGSEQDLRKVTDIAREMITVYGMGEAAGRMAIGKKSGEVFLGKDLAAANNVSADIMSAVDAEIRNVIDRAETRAEEILRRHSKQVDEIVELLMEHETLTGPVLDAIIDSVSIESSRVKGVAAQRRPRATTSRAGKVSVAQSGRQKRTIRLP